MQNVYTVGQINSYIRRMFAEDFLLQELNIKGEVIANTILPDIFILHLRI